MSLTPTYTPGKHCFVACPPDRCTCMPPPPPPLWIPLPFDDNMCDACRRGGVCGCVRPERQVTC